MPLQASPDDSLSSIIDVLTEDHRKVLRMFEQRMWPEPQPRSGDRSAAQSRPRVDLNARMRAMWR